jgi:uncharacterized protein YbbK (DUF523 family)
MVIASACLIGLDSRYNGKNKENKMVGEMLSQVQLVPICPEQAGGLCTPRPPAEIVGGSGLDVLENRARVINKNGEDVTEFYIKGAFQVLKLAKTMNCTRAVLKERSPSCGVKEIFDGSFNGTLRKGPGVTTALLVKEGIKVASEHDLGKTRIWN